MQQKKELHMGLLFYKFNSISLDISILPHSSDLICDEKQPLIFHFHPAGIW